MEHVVAVDVTDGRNQLSRNRNDVIRGKGCATILDQIQKIWSIDVVDGHVGGFIVFKNLVHADDVGMLQHRQVARFIDKELYHRLQFGRMRPGPRPHQSGRAATEGVGKALLDDDCPIQAVLGQIGDPEPTIVEKLSDRILAVQKLGAGLKLVYHAVHSVPTIGRWLLPGSHMIVPLPFAAQASRMLSVDSVQARPSPL